MAIFSTRRPQYMHEPGCSCDVCTAPGLWKSVLESSVTKPEAVASTHAKRDSGPTFRVPSWVFPSTSAERKGMEDVEKGVVAEGNGEIKLDLDAILEGRTKSPVSLGDLRAYVRTERDRESLCELAALDFLMAFNRYKASFFALHPSQQAPDPCTVIEQLTTVGIDARPPVPPKDPQYVEISSPVRFTHPRGPSSDAPLPALPGRAVLPDDIKVHARKRSKPCDLDSLPLLVIDPTVQPLRSELQTIVDSYLSGIPSALLMTIVPSDVISLALSETELTTHPSTLLPVANALAAHFTERVLPHFFRDAVINLSRTTSHGRLLMAILVLVVALGLSATFIVLRGVFPRWSRLALAPLYLASIGYAIGSRTGLCFWLAWRGTREAKAYEEEEEKTTGAADRQLLRRTETILSGSAESTLSDSFSQEGKSHRTCLSIYTINATSLAEKGYLGRKASTKTLPRRQRVLPRKERLIRMTGTATSTVRVEDAYVRRAQLKIAVQVTLLLFVSTAAVMVVVMMIP